MTDSFPLSPTSLAVIVHASVVIAVLVRVIMNRPATGVALAWSLLVTSIPVVGVTLYLLIGERRIGRRRMLRLEELRSDYQQLYEAVIDKGLIHVDWSRHGKPARAMDRLGQAMVGSPTVHGSRLQLIDDTREILEGIVADIDAAQSSVLMEFYIWSEGGLADVVLEALIRASRRGVVCRVLIDALGARPWWRGRQPQRLRDAGVEVRPALPVGPFRSLFGRTDLRLHRKIVVVDSRTAWTGSMNLVDPRFFKQDAGVGQWVDAMLRVEGSAVVPLATTMVGDWIAETGEPLADVVRSVRLHLVEPEGTSDVQVIPSGPGEIAADGLLQMFLTLMHSAETELVVTTPYLVPDDALIRAFRGAAARGVAVKLIVPEKVDSFLARYASRSYYDDLLDSGVEIYLYRGGLLHTKSMMVDRARSMFGTVNLDMRSFWLNYEVSLFVYDADFATRLHELQQHYLRDAIRVDPERWRSRPFGGRFLENTLRLFSPLL